MSNMPSIYRGNPLTTQDGDPDGTRGILVLSADGQTGNNEIGGETGVGNAMFRLVSDGSTEKPPRYMTVSAWMTGTDAASGNVLLVCEQWDPGAVLGETIDGHWHRCAAVRVLGETLLDSGSETIDPTQYGHLSGIQCHRGATHGRFYAIGIGALDIALHIIAYPDNND